LDEEMPRIISIRASDVAAIIGHHPYKPRDEILNEFWKRYAPESFQGRTALEDAQEVLEHSSTARNILYAAIHEKPKDSTQVQQVFKKARLALEADDQLTETQKTTVIDHLRSRVYTSHGTRSEHKTSHKISASAEEGVRIVRDPKVYTLPLHTAGSREFVLTGKIDRIEEITSAWNGDTVEIYMRVTWRKPRAADDANRLYLVNHEAEEDYDFLADSSTATTICQRLDEETKEFEPRLRARIIKTYFGCRGDKDPATLPVQDPDSPLFVDIAIPHPRDWEELWVRAQSNPQFLSTGTEGKYCIPDAFSTLVGFPLVRSLADFWAQHVAPLKRGSARYTTLESDHAKEKGMVKLPCESKMLCFWSTKLGNRFSWWKLSKTLFLHPHEIQKAANDIAFQEDITQKILDLVPHDGP
jgi:hypothetical protein